MNIDKMIDWSMAAIDFFKNYYKKNKEFIDNLQISRQTISAWCAKTAPLISIMAFLRAVDSEGKKILNDIDYQILYDYIEEEVKSWSYMKFPYLKEFGQKGWYRVGPLARMNTCDFIPTPLAQKEFEIFRSYNGGKPV